MTDRARQLVDAAATQVLASLEAEWKARELLWRASREEGASFHEISEDMDHHGFPWTTDGVKSAVRQQEDENAERYDFEQWAEAEFKKWREGSDDGA